MNYGAPLSLFWKLLAEVFIYANLIAFPAHYLLPPIFPLVATRSETVKWVVLVSALTLLSGAALFAGFADALAAFFVRVAHYIITVNSDWNRSRPGKSSLWDHIFSYFFNGHIHLRVFSRLYVVLRQLDFNIRVKPVVV